MVTLKKLRDRSTWVTQLWGGAFGLPIRKVRICPICLHEEVAAEQKDIPKSEIDNYKKQLEKKFS